MRSELFLVFAYLSKRKVLFFSILNYFLQNQDLLPISLLLSLSAVLRNNHILIRKEYHKSGSTLRHTSPEYAGNHPKSPHSFFS